MSADQKPQPRAVPAHVPPPLVYSFDGPFDRPFDLCRKPGLIEDPHAALMQMRPGHQRAGKGEQACS